jgi:hypothetical protein
MGGGSVSDTDRSGVTWFLVIGIALIVVGLIQGLVPANSSEFNCGSPFLPNTSDDTDSDALTDEGDAACNIDGGLASRRSTAFSLIGAAVVFLGASILLTERAKKRHAELTAASTPVAAQPSTQPGLASPSAAAGIAARGSSPAAEEARPPDDSAAPDPPASGD